ncbi:MAG: hypothetical protein ACK5N8_00600 [Alphaproteobacteria bacterium]
MIKKERRKVSDFDFANQFIGKELFYQVQNRSFYSIPYYQLEDFTCVMPYKTFPSVDFLPMVITGVNVAKRAFYVSVSEKTYEVEIINTSIGVLGYNSVLENVFFQAEKSLVDGSKILVCFFVKGKEIKVIQTDI